MLTWFFLQAIGYRCHPLIQNLVDQAALAGTGNSGNADQLAQRKFHIDIFQVILTCTLHNNAVAVSFSALVRHKDLLRT